MKRILQKVILWDFMQLLEKKEGMQLLDKVRFVIEEIISKNIRWMLKSLFLLKLRDSKIMLKKIAEDHGLEEISCNLCGLRDFEIIARKNGFRTVRCLNCGLCFVTPRFNQKARELFYASKYHVNGYSLFNTLNKLDSVINDHFLSEQILGLIKTYKKSGDLMEVGSFGQGLIRSAEGSGFRCWKIKSDGWIYDTPFKGRDYRTNDGCLSINNRKFDVISCLDVLDRVPSPVRELNGINGILKDDGILLVRVPNFGSKIAEEKGITWHHNRPWEKIFQFDYLRLQKMLDRVCFEIIDIETELSNGVGYPGGMIIIARKKRYRNRRKNPKILLIRNGARGDVLLTTPIVKALKEKYPQSSITFKTDFPEILENNPCLDKLITRIEKDAYDVVYNLRYELYPGMPIIKAYSRIAQINVNNPRLEFYITGKEKEEIEVILASHQIKKVDRLAVLHPMVGQRIKSWKREKYQKVCDFLHARDYKVVTVGNPADCVELMGANNLIGKISIRMVAAAISKGDIFIGLDSFPMHLANAFGIPSVILFGSTDPNKVICRKDIVHILQSDESCLGCRQNTTPDKFMQNISCARERLYCMENISAEMVIAAFEESLTIHDKRCS